MLPTGILFSEPGCWELTAHYADAALTVTLDVEPETPV